MPLIYVIAAPLFGLLSLALGFQSGHFFLVWTGGALLVVPPVQFLDERFREPLILYLRRRCIKKARVRFLSDAALALVEALPLEHVVAWEDFVDPSGAPPPPPRRSRRRRRAIRYLVDPLSASPVPYPELEALVEAGLVRGWAFRHLPRWQIHPDARLFVALERARREQELLEPGPRPGPRLRQSTLAERVG